MRRGFPSADARAPPRTAWRERGAATDVHPSLSAATSTPVAPPIAVSAGDSDATTLQLVEMPDTVTLVAAIPGFTRPITLENEFSNIRPMP